jgi:hypothetical protein
METTKDPDVRVEEARESMLNRVEELGRRIQGAKAKLDVPAHIAAHPWLGVGIAFAAGVLLGFPGKRTKTSAVSSKGEAKSGLMGAAIATIGSLAFQLAKNVAFHQLSGEAKNWWDRKYGVGSSGLGNTEADVSRTRDIEAFLEH